MANNNEWSQPKNPPPPLFAGKKERDFVKQINQELMENVIGQQILYYPINIEHTDFDSVYGEAMNKTFLPPIRVYVLVDWEPHETIDTPFGIDRRNKLTLHFHNRRLTEDQDLYVREGDFVLFGDYYYEIIAWRLPTLLFGQVESKIEISADCLRARTGVFDAK